MNDESRLNFNALHNLEKKSNARPYSDESSCYLKYLNESKKGVELENSSPYQSFAKEIKRLNEQIDELKKERLGLKQQCQAAIKQWDKTLRENNEAKDQLVHMQHQRDEALKKINHEISQRVKGAKDLTRLTEERNSAVHEYNLIMSERDTVHKEMEKMNEELGQCKKRLKSLDSEKKSLLDDVESLKKEIMANKMKSMDKEFLMKQMYKEKYSDAHFAMNHYAIKSSSSNKWGSSSSGFSSGWTQYGNLKNPLSSTSILQSFNPIDRKQFSISTSSSVSTMANHKSKSELSDNELELRKQIQTLEYDYNNVLFEMQNCLLQNEKVVQERESIKTLCDKLRRERDRAIRDRAEAIQDLNDFRLKIESNAQLKKYMENLSEMNHLDQSKSGKQTTSSKDSAISADIQETSDYENMSVLLINNFRHNNSKYNPWGFSVRSNEKCVLVSGINMESPAEDKLKLNDIILSIQSISLSGDESMCNELLCKYDKELQLVIQRKRQFNSVLNIDLDCSKGEHGIVLENAFLIKKLLPDCVAAKNEHIAVGDRLLSINGNSLDSSTMHDVMNMLRENKLLLKVYKQSLNHQTSGLNNVFEQTNEPSDSQMKSKLDNHKPTYQKDDLHLTTKSNYLPNIGHYQSIKRSSKKSKTLLNDSSSSFGNSEYEKGSPTLLNKTFNLFKKSYKSKNEKKDQKKSTPETETLDDFNKILNNLSERDSKTKPGKSSIDKNSVGTWPSCKSNTNLLSSPTYGKVNPISSTTYSKKKERKSLAIFTNYTKNDQAKSNCVFESSNEQDKSMSEYDKDYKSFHDYHLYGVVQSKTSRTDTPVLDNSYKSLVHNQGKHNSLSSSYSSKDNHHKSNNAKKYTLNHEIVYKSFNAPSSSSSIQMDQEYQMKKSKEKHYLDAYQKENKFKPTYTHPSYTDLQDEKSSKDANFQLSHNLNSSFGFYSLTNKRQLITNNLTSNYTQDLETYLNNNSSVDQGLTGSNGTFGQSGDAETNSSINPYFLSSNIENVTSQKKSSPININQLKALNRLSITSSPSYHLNDNPLSNSPSHYATFSNNAQLSKDNYYLNKHQNNYERTNNASSNLYGYINQTSPLHQSNNPVESVLSLSSNIYPQDDFLINNKNHRFYISSNNSVASKLSNCSVDSNSIYSNAINPSYFKKITNNESIDSASYSNVQNLRNQVGVLNRKKNLSIDNKANSHKLQQNLSKKSTDCPESKVAENSLEVLNVYSATDDENAKVNEIRSICIEKSKEKSLGIQIECGNNDKISAPGIFVSCVNEGSLAKKVGLKVGDQLLEICGINMRSANKDAAANVLRQCGQTVIMKVQYNPDKFFNKEHSDQKCVSNESNNEQDKVEQETNLDGQEDEKNELEDTLKNFEMNARQRQMSCETIDKEDAYSNEKFLYF